MTKQSLSRWGQLYVGSIALFGLFAIAQSIHALYTEPIGWNWFILAVLTLISGSATVKLPSVPATISISETFVFTSVLLFGPAAGTLTVAIDALVISLWLARRGHPFYRIAFNVGALPAAMWLAAHFFYAVWNMQPLSLVSTPVDIGALFRPLLLFTILYFLLNSWPIAFAIAIEKHVSPLNVWRHNFVWISLNYFGGASVAALLVTYTRNIDFAYLAFVLPLLAALYLTFVMSMGRVEDANRHLTQLNALYMSTIETLAMAIDAKDQITHGHIRRVQQYAVGLAHALGVKDTAQIRAIEAASLLHDMGKLAVPEYILNKPGPLTAAEFDKMKLHASVGADILSAIEFPYPVVPIVRHHHESWDGTGYPDGLRGSAIPIGARILSVVDCFDALTSDRPYRPRLADSEALRILQERRGKMYDPLVVDKFVEVYADIVPGRLQEVQTATGLSAITRSLAKPEGVTTGSGLDNIAASTEEMLVLYDLARSLAGRNNLTDATDIISKHLRRVVPAATYVFFLYDDKSDQLIAAHASGESSEQFVGLRIPRGERLTGWVAANKQTIVNSDPVLDLGEVARSMRPRFNACLSTPLVSESGLVGVLSLYAIPREAFTDDHKRVIEAVARQVSDAIKNASLSEKDIAKTEQSFGSSDFKHIERLVATEIAAVNTPGSLSLIFVDVVALKTITRRFGRERRDEVQQAFMDIIRTVLRAGDVLYQYGPDQLIVLLLQADADSALSIARRIVENVSNHKPMTIDDVKLSFTFGIASAPKDGLTLGALISTAQKRERLRDSVSHNIPPSIH
jgi:diguanylate cyclase (GGDEF)-like protein/putative nucleotidyltransferase with HDIG domain